MSICRSAETSYLIAGKFWDLLYELAAVGDLPLPEHTPSPPARKRDWMEAGNYAIEPDLLQYPHVRHIAGQQRASQHQSRSLGNNLVPALPMQYLMSDYNTMGIASNSSPSYTDSTDTMYNFGDGLDSTFSPTSGIPDNNASQDLIDMWLASAPTNLEQVFFCLHRISPSSLRYTVSAIGTIIWAKSLDTPNHSRCGTLPVVTLCLIITSAVVCMLSVVLCIYIHCLSIMIPPPLSNLKVCSPSSKDHGTSSSQ